MTQYESMTRDELLAELKRKDRLLVSALASNEERYRTLFMSMREGFFLSRILYDENGAPCDYRYLDVNPALAAMLGMELDDIINKRMTEIVPNHSRFWMDVFQQVATTGTSSYCCYYSEPFCRHFEIFAFRPGPDRYAVLVTDITERLRAEQALVESEARLRVFIEHAPACLAMFDRNMRYLVASRRWIEHYGLGDRDLAGQSHYEVFPEIRDDWREAHLKGLAGEVCSSDGERFQHRDGSMHWESWKIHPWYDRTGAVGGIVLFTEDITELKKTEEELRKSEQRYRDIVQNQSEYVDRYLPGGILTFVNDSLARTTGLAPEELLGKSFYGFLHDEDREEVIRTIESLSAENPAVMAENRVVLPDGVHWFQWKHCALLDSEGNIVEYQATGRDITERRQMQDDLLKHQNELKLANELLEQRVKERTADLEAAIRAQESFSYSVSHDLRAPLRHINSFSAMLIEDFLDFLPDQARDYLDRICAASSRMGALIDHLLELSRVTRAQIDPGMVDLTELAVSTLRMFQETEPERSVEVMVEQGVTVMGDNSLLRQLLENLLGNAWKYTSKKERARIEFGKAVVSGQEAYFVKDNGAGFEMQYVEKLFKAFERLHGAEFEGIGIGLATAQRIIQRHGGTIWAEGAVGQGATFYFTLPVYF